MTHERLYCATHPKVETNLRCGKCGKLICPKCLVYTPVGARCRDCAQLRRLPMYELTPSTYLSSVGAGLGIAVVAGIVWMILPQFVAIWVPLLVGYVAGEGISLAANRKRGLALQVIAGTTVFLSYLIWRLLPLLLALSQSRPGHVASAFFSLGTLGVILAGLLNLYLLVVLALGIFLAVNRVR